MIEESVLQGLREKYPNIHPLIFHRSKERAKSAGELFDILDAFPYEYPVVWNEESKRWVKTKDIYQAMTFKEKE